MFKYLEFWQQLTLQLCEGFGEQQQTAQMAAAFVHRPLNAPQKRKERQAGIGMNATVPHCNHPEFSSWVAVVEKGNCLTSLVLAEAFWQWNTSVLSFGGLLFGSNQLEKLCDYSLSGSTPLKGFACSQSELLWLWITWIRLNYEMESKCYGAKAAPLNSKGNCAWLQVGFWDVVEHGGGSHGIWQNRGLHCKSEENVKCQTARCPTHCI